MPRPLQSGFLSRSVYLHALRCSQRNVLILTIAGKCERLCAVARYAMDTTNPTIGTLIDLASAGRRFGGQAVYSPV